MYDKKIEKLNKKITRAKRFNRIRKSIKLKRKLVKLEIKSEKYLGKAQKSTYTIQDGKKYKRLRILSKVLPIVGVLMYLYFAIYSKLIINEPEIKPILLDFTYGMFDVGVIAAAIALLLIPLYYTGKLFFGYLKASKVTNDIAENLGSVNFKYDPNVRLFWTGLFGSWIFPFIYLANRFGYKMYDTVNTFIDEINSYLDLQSNEVSEVFKEFVTEFTTDFASMFEKGIFIMFIAYMSWFVMDMLVVRAHEYKKRKHNKMKQYSQTISEQEQHESMSSLIDIKETQDKQNEIINQIKETQDNNEEA